MKEDREMPLGLIPREIHIQTRIGQILGAIERFMLAKEKIPMEWIEEYNELIEQ